MIEPSNTSCNQWCHSVSFVEQTHAMHLSVSCLRCNRFHFTLCGILIVLNSLYQRQWTQWDGNVRDVHVICCMSRLLCHNFKRHVHNVDLRSQSLSTTHKMQVSLCDIRGAIYAAVVAIRTGWCLSRRWKKTNDFDRVRTFVCHTDDAYVSPRSKIFESIALERFKIVENRTSLDFGCSMATFSCLRRLFYLILDNFTIREIYIERLSDLSW
jgi:hypothetical protein